MDEHPQFNAPPSAPMNPDPSGPTPPPQQAAGPEGPFPRVKRKRRGTRVLGLLAIILLALGSGGVAGVATTLLVLDEASTPTPAIETQQADQPSSNAPNWAETAEAVSGAVVAIKVSGSSGAGEGSGVILDDAGHIVTNNHVIAGSGSDSKIRVVMGTNTYEASTVGADPSTDLAVIRLDNPPEDLTAIEFGDSSKLRVGDPVMAIGNPLGLSDTVTTGIVSALDRPVATREVTSNQGESDSGTVVTAAIQTNAAINPGNSGGALVDASGKLVGITSSIASLAENSSEQAGNIGIGFAIPSSQVRTVSDQLIADGVAQHAQLGVNVVDATSSAQLGTEVTEVTPDSAAAEAGVKVGDVITAMDSRPVASSEALVALVRSSDVGQQVELKIFRGDEQLVLEATLQAAEE